MDESQTLDEIDAANVWMSRWGDVSVNDIDKEQV